MTVRLADLGAPFATGRSAELHDWPGTPDTVVKVFAPTYPSALVDQELVASTEAARLVETVVPCLGRVDVEGRAGLLFSRVRGTSLTAQAEKNPLTIRPGARVLASEHARLHEVTTDRFTDVKTATIEALDSPPLAFLCSGKISAAKELVAVLPDGDRFLHLDFHTENVFSHDDGHVVIDWQTAMRGAPAADVAATVLLLRDAELWPGTPAIKRFAIGLVRKTVLSTYLAEYRRLTGMTLEEIDAWRLPAVVLRMSILDIASERPGFQSELSTLLETAR